MAFKIIIFTIFSIAGLIAFLIYVPTWYFAVKESKSILKSQAINLEKSAYKELLTVGCDISTYEIAMSCIDHNYSETKHIVFKSKKKEFSERLKELNQQFTEFLDGNTDRLDFVILKNYKLFNSKTTKLLNTVEGMLASALTLRDFRYDFINDSSFAKYLGVAGKVKETKKIKTLEFYAEINKIDGEVMPLKAGKWHLVSDKGTITDDIADAFACAYWYSSKIKWIRMKA